MVWVLVVAVISVAFLAAGFVISRRGERAFIEERIGLPEEGEPQEGLPSIRSSPLGDLVNRQLARRGLGANLATQLARADVKLTVGEFLAATVILVILGTGVSYWLTRDYVISGAVCLAGIFSPRIYVAVLRSRRLKAFNNQLSDTINLLVNGLRSGYSVLQAMEAVSREMSPPVSTEFGRVVREVQLGLTLEQALSNMLRRITSDDLDMMVTAVNVQREVGGNLAEVLDSISHTIRERIRIKGEINALTAQSRWSGYIIAMVPIAIAGVIYVINPGFMSKLFTHICGWIMIGVALTGIVTGFFFIRKVISIEV
jgi:tight adherence protein B